MTLEENKLLCVFISNRIKKDEGERFYYEQQIKRELKGIHPCGCRCSERLKTKTDGSTLLTYTAEKGRKIVYVVYH